MPMLKARTLKPTLRALGELVNKNRHVDNQKNNNRR
jgi:hypothetical protein